MFKYFFVSTLDTKPEPKPEEKKQNKKWEYPFNIHYRNAFRKLWIDSLNK